MATGMSIGRRKANLPLGSHGIPPHRNSMRQRLTTAAKDKAEEDGFVNDWSEELCLLGPRQLQSLLSWAVESSPGFDAPRRADMAQRWREAAAVYRDLSRSEPTAADKPQVLPLPRALARHVAQLTQTSAFRHSFDVVPVAFGLVELDKLVVSQYCITQNLVRGIDNPNSRPPSGLKLAQLCLPIQPRTAGFKLLYQDEGEYVFSARHHDLRFLGATLLAAPELAALNLEGHPQAALALGVGTSCNLVDVVRWGNRLVLNNGHHRAYALRAQGLTHVPCVIQVCSSADELALAASTEIADNSDLYFDLPRPPLLRDFDNPALTHTVTTPRLHRQVRVSFKIESRLLAHA